MKNNQRKKELTIAFYKSAETTSTYSAMMRELNKNDDKELREEFMRRFKDAFDEAMEEGLEDASTLALMQAKKSLGSGVSPRLLSLAQVATYSNSADQVGKTLAAIVNVIISRAPHDPVEAKQRIREKLLTINSNEVSQKNMPASASYGQAITLVKTMLNGYDASFVSQSIKSLVRYL